MNAIRDGIFSSVRDALRNTPNNGTRFLVQLIGMLIIILIFAVLW